MSDVKGYILMMILVLIIILIFTWLALFVTSAYQHAGMIP